MKNVNYQNILQRSLLSSAVAVAGLAITGNTVAAQLEEVVVTAQKRSQSANDVGITINAFTGEQLKDFGVLTAEDIAMMTPGLTVNETAATGVPLYSIRGVGFQDYSTAASSTVGIYFDEIAMPYTVMTRGLVFDTERVEVLKGPQGDLYGRNTTAGQINFISNKPTRELEAGVSASYGNFSTYEVEGFASGGNELVQGRVAFKTSQSNEGWQKSTTRDDELGEKDVSALRGIVNFDPTDTLRLQLTAHYVTDKSENKANAVFSGTEVGLGEFSNPYTPLEEYLLPTGSNFGQTPPWYASDDSQAADWTNSYTSPITGKTFDIRPQRDNQLTGFAARLEWDVAGTTVTSITGYNEFERVEANDWDGGFYTDSSNINTTDLKVFSQELRIAGETGNLNWIAGLYYSTDEMDEYYHYFMADSVFGFGSIPWGVDQFAATPILELDTKYEQETDSAAVFGHIEWQFTDTLRLTLGARYTEEERDWAGCTFVAEDGSLGNFLNAQFGASLGPGDCGTINDNPDSPNYIFSVIGTPDVNDAFQVFKETIETDRWMGKIGLDYALTDDVLLYGMISEGFKSGGFNGANSNTTQQLQPYKEEKLTSYEIGAKATLLDGSMQLNAATFFYDYRDKQEQDISVTFVGNISGLTNVPESEIMGAEMDMQWLPSDRLSVNLGVAWLDTEVKKWNAVDPAASAWPVTVRRDVSGIELAQAPEWAYTAMVSYQWPVAQGLMMEVAGDVSFTDDTTGGIDPENSTEDYTLFNARLGLGPDSGQWRALLWARNLTDEDYYPAAYTGGNGPYVRSYGMPRTYGITLSYNTGR
ncbi:TonB-dependent receptor [Kineobactrum salinum]|uniref:TonB-dependent receptor n=1 Tax=Kineobactrum salinum TaxID=2708301 RepID=A0A6C0TYW9_9GAMM|nr:TonB-dependent receptor [Kineobactrum salinum]QIB64569.1 TonB-dependent receptor [Kineobactrum salinum]